MSDSAALSSVLPILVLSLPVAALLALLVLLFVRRRPRQEEQAAPRAASPPVQTSVDLAVTAAKTDADAQSGAEPLASPAEEAPEAPEADVIRHIGPVADPKSPSELLDDIKLAERAGNHALLARLCLDLAQAEPGHAHVPELLRKCVRAAMRSKSFAVHAAARLELADRARLAGDLTTACEHWQIARGLFFDMNDRELHKTAEGLMLRHGCPTDWILTDF